MTTRTNRDQYLLDVFTTAMEGGIGYWSYALNYHWSNEDGTEDYQGFYADIIDVEEDNRAYHINRRIISHGYRLASTKHRQDLCWSTEPPPVVITDDTDWDYDAGDADMIVQLGLFGRVVYG